MRMFERASVLSVLLAAVAPAFASAGDEITETRKLRTTSGGTGDRFGQAVAISARRVLIGSPFDDTLGFDTGAGYLLDRVTGEQLFKLALRDTSDSASAGISVALTPTLAALGAPGQEDDQGVSAGAVFLFDATTGVWQRSLRASDGASGDIFGTAIAAFGSTLVVGAPNDDDNGNASGGAYLFDMETGEQLFKLDPLDGAGNDRFGISVAISGTRAVVGAYFADIDGAQAGAAYVFDVATGQQVHKLVAHDADAGDLFGVAVAIDGDRVLVGASGDNEAGSGAGALYVFDAETGAQLAKLIPPGDATNDQFGESIAMEGDRAVVGAAGADGAGDQITNTGEAYLYDMVTGERIGEFFRGDADQTDLFGAAVALDGAGVLVGAPSDNDFFDGLGSVYQFRIGGVDDPCRADWDGNGVVNSADVGAYLSAYFVSLGPCP